MVGDLLRFRGYSATLEYFCNPHGLLWIKLSRLEEKQSTRFLNFNGTSFLKSRTMWVVSNLTCDQSDDYYHVADSVSGFEVICGRFRICRDFDQQEYERTGLLLPAEFDTVADFGTV